MHIIELETKAIKKLEKSESEFFPNTAWSIPSGIPILVSKTGKIEQRITHRVGSIVDKMFRTVCVNIIQKVYAFFLLKMKEVANHFATSFLNISKKSFYFNFCCFWCVTSVD